MKRKDPMKDITQLLINKLYPKFKEISNRVSSQKELKEEIGLLFDRIRWDEDDQGGFYALQRLLITWAFLQVDLKTLLKMYWNPSSAKKLREQKRKEKELADKMVSGVVYKKSELENL